MRKVLAELEQQLDKFDRRAKQLGPLALQDPVQDTDERAAMTLLVSGSLELFLKDVTQTYVTAVCARGADFDKLPTPVKRTHYEEGAQVLLRVARRDWNDIKSGRASDFVGASDVCRRLSSVGSPKYELVWEGFARTDSNANPETIEKILKRLDVKHPWKTLEASIPSGIHPLPPGPTRANKLNADLRALRDARNRCAHGNAGAAAPGWSLLLEYILALKAIAGGMVGSLESRLVNMPS